MPKQNQHHARFIHRGNIANSHGTKDRMKAVKTKSDGRLHWSMLDIYPILKNINLVFKDKIFPDEVTISDDGTSNFVVINKGFDSSLKNIYIKGTANANAQDIDFVAGIHLPYEFREWDTNAAITGYFYISDQASVTATATLYSPGEANPICIKNFTDMTKEVIGPGNIAKVTFTFSMADMYSLIPAIEYGIENEGTETVCCLIHISMDQNHWAKLVGETFSWQCTMRSLQEDADDGWEAPLCGECDTCDSCDHEGGGAPCGSCDTDDTCDDCDVCDNTDE